MRTTSKLGPVLLDVAGTSLSQDDIRRLQYPLTGGMILFGRNFTDRETLIRLTAEIREANPHILITVDHEGGRVQRFKKDGFTHLPAMRRLGEIFEKNDVAAMECATATGYVLAAELRACGIDMSFTPVLDLDYGRSGVIGDRAFHGDPRIVALLAKSLNHGLLMAGMANCGKHFPGHGYVEVDSHVAIPVDERTFEEITQRDCAPYHWTNSHLTGVMPAHVIYPKVDPNPAGFSAKWLKILRQDFGFNGVIFSDDLSMEGASVAGSVVQGAEAALQAGCDMVLICNSPDKADQLLNQLDTTAMLDYERSMQRIRALKPTADFCTWEELQQLPTYQTALAKIAALCPAQM